MSASARRREIELRATEAGFDRVAVARVGQLDDDASRLDHWLKRGYHASMEWMARDPSRRADPGSVVPGCKSVVSLAIHHGAAPDVDPVRRGKVARYARGRDYHRVMGGRLRSLAAWLEERTDLPARAFVDTGPVLERGWAQRAGLGWIGKNSCLLTRDLGSWILLGEILTAAEIEPDRGPHADFCGTCTACLDACPTNAILEPGVVDSNACVSFWTIEHRGAVPVNRRPGNGTWMFGCDDCQTVCPWNRTFGRPAGGGAFESRDDLGGVDPIEILGMGEAEFRQTYSGTPLMRAKWEGMRRNACIVLGNLRDADAVPHLVVALDDDDAVVRSHAGWALGRIGGPAARAALETSLGREDVAEVAGEWRQALEALAEA